MFDLFFLYQFFVSVLQKWFLFFGQVIKMDQGAACPVCYQPLCFCSEVPDNRAHFSIKIVKDDFKDGVVSCYIICTPIF
jgi:hypothetical protein